MLGNAFRRAKEVSSSTTQFTDAPATNGVGGYAPVVGSSGSMMANGAAPNGRIDLLSPLPEFNIPNYQQRSVTNETFVNEATYGRIQPNELSNIFFSEANIEALQQGIRYRVFVETNGQFTIGRQSDQELKVIMRSIYLQYSKNTPHGCIEQVRDLNAKVLEWAVPEVLSNVKQYSVYRKDASTMPMPLEHAPLMTMKGTKVLEQKKWI